MQINPHIFREYDVRGLVGEDLSDQFAYVLGLAYGGLAKEKGNDNIGIGWDCRISSPGYAKALANGIADAGLDVQLTGMGPTPQLYFSIFQRKLGGGIQVTGSHNPPNMYGFKICVGTQTLSGAEIQDLKIRVNRVVAANCPKAAKIGTIKEAPIQEE